MDRGSGFVV